MRIIITGDKGLIGTFLSERLKKEGHEIILTIDLKDGKDIHYLKKTGTDFLGKADMVIHAAAFCKINKCIETPTLAHENSTDVFEVLEFCRINKIPKLVFFSSSRILCEEKNPYTSCKIYGEELCKAYKQCYDIDYIIIRPSTVYGPILDKTKRLMHIFISNALLGKDLEIYGDPKTKTLDFTYVDDFIDGVMLIINNSQWNKEFNISGNQEYNIFQLAEFIVSETSSSSKIKVYDPEIAQPQIVRLDLSGIEKLGYSPKIPIKEGVKRNIEKYKEFYLEDKNVFDF
jgi:nucleoside-diphosphate-sugar epimerase